MVFRVTDRFRVVLSLRLLSVSLFTGYSLCLFQHGYCLSSVLDFKHKYIYSHHNQIQGNSSYPFNSQTTFLSSVPFITLSISLPNRLLFIMNKTLDPILHHSLMRTIIFRITMIGFFIHCKDYSLNID
jgi:hypothetical protein